jgi:hypothetical protein
VALESQFPEIVETKPELLAHHCGEAGLIEKAADLWGKAGRRSVERSALVEAVVQLTRALDQIATLPGTPPLRREQIRLQVALITPLIHVKGYAAPETKAAAERARVLVEEAERAGESLETLVWLSVLYSTVTTNIVDFNGDLYCITDMSLTAFLIWNKHSRFTILPSIVCWPSDSAKMPDHTPCAIGHWPFGYLVILRPHSQTRITRSVTRARSVKPVL